MTHEDQPQTIEDDTIRVVVRRLARRHPSGGDVIERAAIIAEADAVAILEWVTAHDGQPEGPVRADLPGRGLHSERINSSRARSSSTPRRYILPPGALSDDL